MATRIPASQCTREELIGLIEGRLFTASAKDELVKLATRLIVEEALEGEACDAVGRDYYEHGAQPGHGYRNGYRAGRPKISMPSSLSAPASQGITAENSNQKRSSFAVLEQRSKDRSHCTTAEALIAAG